MKAFQLPILAIAGISEWLGGEAGATMAGRLYLTDGPAQRLYSIEDGAIGVNVPTPTGQGPLAIGSTIRTLGRSNNITGSEYTLSGALTGTTPSYGIGGSPLFLDGTTDGVFNYSIELNTSVVYRFNLDWSSPSVLFPANLTTGERSGITFDPTSDCLWITGINGAAMGRLEKYTLGGVHVFAINAGAPAAALAFDHVDQTLWLDELGTGIIKQYSLEGVFLSSITIPALAGSSIDGAEFAIPEPAISVLWFAGLIGLLRQRVRRARAG